MSQGIQWSCRSRTVMVFGRSGTAGFVIKNTTAVCVTAWISHGVVLTRAAIARCWETSDYKLLPFPSWVERESWLVSLRDSVLTVVIWGEYILLCKWIQDLRLCCPRYENYIARRFGFSAYIFPCLKIERTAMCPACHWMGMESLKLLDNLFLHWLPNY